jgi:tetratricopeptide (TPR) repeat protein
MLVRTTLALSLLTLAAPRARAQLASIDARADSARVEIEAATSRGDVARLRAELARLDHDLAATPDDAMLLHYRGYALYRIATLTTGRAHEGEAKALFREADRALERSAARLPLAETYALRAAVTGNLIGSNPFDVVRLGRRSRGLMDRALELGPENPRVWLLNGAAAMHTPGMFGGGLDRAEERVRRAIALFESDRPAPPAPAWGRAEAFVWLGQILERKGKPEDARAEYARAIAAESEFEWPRRLTEMLGRQ